jgi:hypothetical protein
MAQQLSTKNKQLQGLMANLSIYRQVIKTAFIPNEICVSTKKLMGGEQQHLGR